MYASCDAFSSHSSVLRRRSSRRSSTCTCTRVRVCVLSAHSLDFSSTVFLACIRSVFPRAVSSRAFASSLSFSVHRLAAALSSAAVRASSSLRAATSAASVLTVSLSVAHSLSRAASDSAAAAASFLAAWPSALDLASSPSRCAYLSSWDLASSSSWRASSRSLEAPVNLCSCSEVRSSSCPKLPSLLFAAAHSRWDFANAALVSDRARACSAIFSPAAARDSVRLSLARLLEASCTSSSASVACSFALSEFFSSRVFCKSSICLTRFSLSVLSKCTSASFASMVSLYNLLFARDFSSVFLK
mmetsp:Transcript_24542/g.46544  ORF Transcript_24542/g.46544 Transcript_24542/m.46544 type:complete len:302 (+) Transcript_24542:473-1378(+)